MKKIVNIICAVLTSVFQISCGGQNQTNSAKDDINPKATRLLLK